MSRAFVYGFDAPGCVYRRPLLLAPSFVRAAFEYQCDHDAELARLIAEQAAEMAAGDGDHEGVKEDRTP